MEFIITKNKVYNKYISDFLDLGKTFSLSDIACNRDFSYQRHRTLFYPVEVREKALKDPPRGIGTHFGCCFPINQQYVGAAFGSIFALYCPHNKYKTFYDNEYIHIVYIRKRRTCVWVCVCVACVLVRSKCSIHTHFLIKYSRKTVSCKYHIYIYERLRARRRSI